MATGINGSLTVAQKRDLIAEILDTAERAAELARLEGRSAPFDRGDTFFSLCVTADSELVSLATKLGIDVAALKARAQENTENPDAH